MQYFTYSKHCSCRACNALTRSEWRRVLWYGAFMVVMLCVIYPWLVR
jgi:hypothetical protein